MKSIILKKLSVFLFLIGTLCAFGQQIVLSDKTRASVITCDTGNESYSLFGHTAIRITDLENNLDVVYNYGAFDFNTSNFVVKFAKGDLQYFAVATAFSDFIYQYTYEQRGVFEQELVIPLVYKQKLFNNLNDVLTSDKNHYTYKFIDQNCTTMVVDILNKTLGAKIITKKLDSKKTYRSILFPYFDNFFYEKLGTSIIFGTKVDEVSNHIFLPFELHKSLQQTTLKNQLLCKESKNLLEFEKQEPDSWWNNIYTYLICLGLVLILNNKNIDNLYLVIMGLLGIFFITVGFLSYHQELANNYNVLLFNPILLILAYFTLAKKKKWMINLSMFSIFLLVIYVAIMISKAHFWIVLPILLTNYIILQKILIKTKNLD